MIIKELLLASESYTHQNWIYKDINVGFSRLYYIIDGEAYYEGNGKTVRFKKGHLYLTPIRHPFTIYENPENKLFHTYAHITTLPAVTRFTEIEVKEGTPLADAVALWRKYATCKDFELISNVIQFLLSQIPDGYCEKNSVVQQTKQYIDTLKSSKLDMAELSDALGYSREHITRMFHTVYRTTPTQYFNSRRMNLAVEKLSNGEKIKEVADQLGFETPYSFSKSFKKHFGASPMRYLKELKE